jgi:ABC-2 type transport system permease protein
VNLGPTLASEWLKLRTVRSSVAALVATVVISVGVAALVCLGDRTQWQRTGAPAHFAFSPVGVSLTGFLVAPLAIGVIGVLIITSEYSSGLIRATLAAQPRRLSMLLAKALVLFAVALTVGEVSAFLSFFLGQAILSGVAPSATLGSPGALRAIVLAGLSIALLALLALGIGTMLRHTAASITVYVGVLLILLAIVQALPGTWSTDVNKYMPEVLILAMRSDHAGGVQLNTFSPSTSACILAAYALGSLIVGGWLLVRRDA